MTLCSSLKKNSDYQANIDFFIGNSISNLQQISNPEVKAFYIERYIDEVSPEYARVDQNGKIIPAKKFSCMHNKCESLPPVELYEAFKKALIDANLVRDNYFQDLIHTKETLLSGVVGYSVSLESIEPICV